MRNILFITQIVISLLLIVSVLTQQKGEGLGSAFGGTGGGFYTTKRGAEKVLAIATIVFAVLFIANAIAFLFIK